MNAVIIGYASLDYSVSLDGMFRGDQTTLIKHRASDEWPRPGGSVAYVGRPIATAGQRVNLVTWVGDDDMGRAFKQSCASAGMSVTGIGTVEPGTTPLCLMVYQADGSCACLFDPGFLGREQLSKLQETTIREADLVCITVGPPDIGLRALDLVRDDAIVAWVMKNDLVSFPEQLCKRLAARAQYVFCNRKERPIVDASFREVRPGNTVIIETDGPNEVLVERRDSSTRLPVRTLAPVDTTGAGDTLAGGTLAAVLSGETDPVMATTAGIQASFRMLKERSHRNEQQ